jgi:hypothetical protein
MVTRSLQFDHFQKLTDSIDWANRELEKPRRERISSIRQFVGSHYATNGSEKKVPVNFLKLAVDIYVRQLAARAPRVLISTKFPELKPTAANLQLAVNQIPEEIGLTATLRRLVTEALFSVGIVKTGLHTVGEVMGLPYGEPFVDVVTLDDWFCDMSAKRMDLIQYCGNDYWLPFEEFMDSGFVKRKDRGFLSPDEYSVVDEQGQESGEGISAGESADVYKDRIHLRDVWLPQERVMITYAVTKKRKINDADWEGPEKGPYSVLGYTDVPSNLLPLAPVAVWRDLHELANVVFRKLSNQADGQKSVLGFNSTDEEDIKAFQAAADGDGIPYHGGKPETLTAGGVNNTTLAFYLQVRDLYSYFAGNLDSLGGLAPLTETVGQDKLLSEAASSQLADMSSQTIEVVKGIFRSLAWYEWEDPVGTRTLEKKIPGTELSIPVEWNSEAKQGGFELYDLDLDVFSLVDDSPGTKLQKFAMVLERFVAPMMPDINAAGGNLDAQFILRTIAKWSNLPEVGEMIQWQDQLPQQSSEGTPRRALASSAKKTGEGRISSSKQGATPRGNSQVLQQVLTGANPQQSQVANLPGGQG